MRVLLEIGPLKIYSYGFLMAVALVIGCVGFLRSAKKEGIPEEFVLDLILAIIIGAVILSRLSYIPLNWDYYSANPIQVFNIRQGGLTFHGAVLGGVLGSLLITRWRRLSFGRMADLAAPYLALGYAIARIGCFLNGCCYGKPTSVPWALPCAAGDSLLRHPTQLYSFAAGLLIFLLLLYLKRKKSFPGELFTLYLIFYSIYRFLLEFFRESPSLLGWLTPGQTVSLVLGPAALLFWLWRRYSFNSSKGNRA